MASPLDPSALPTPEEKERRQALDLTQGFALERNPEAAAEAFAHSRETGVPFEQAEGEIKLKGKLTRAPSWAGLEREAPVLAERLSDPGRAASMHDDVPKLKGIERLFGGWNEMGWEGEKALLRGEIQRRLANIGWKQVMQEATPEDLRYAEGLEKEMEKYPESELGFIPGIIPAAVESTPIMGQTIVKAGGITAAAAAVGALIGGAGAALASGGAGVGAGAVGGAKFAAGLVGKAAMGVEAGKVEAGLALRDFSKIPGVDPDAARGASFLVGVANGALEAVALDTILKGVPGVKQVLAARGPRAALAAALRNETGRRVLGGLMKRVAEVGVVEGVTEALQELSNVIGEAAVDPSVQGFNAAVGKVWSQKGRIGQAGVKGFQAGLGFAGMEIGGGIVHDVSTARKAQERKAFFSELAQASKNSKLRERLPAEYREFIDKTAEKYGAVGEATVPADKINALFQAEGWTEADIREKLPGVSAQLAEAAGDPKAEITVLLPDLATHLAPLDGFSTIQDDLRIGDEPTPREGVEIEKRAKEVLAEMKSDEKRAGVVPASSAKIYNDIHEKLTAIGMDEGVAQRYATLWTSFSENRAQRTGADPFEYYKGLGLTLSHSDLVEAIIPESEISTLTPDMVALREKALQGDVDAMNALEEKFSLDEMTGANNPAAFMRFVGGLDEQGRPANAPPGWWLQMDANDLKKANDFFGGHPAGNAYLKMLGTTIGPEVRSRKGKFFRSGGDEFTGFWPASMEAQAREAAAVLAEVLNKAPALFEGKFRGSVSAGLARTFGQADAASYKAKERAKALGRSGSIKSGITPDWSQGDLFLDVDEAPAPTSVQTALAQKIEVTKTAEFKKWFKKSKVVDENGEPLIVYHGTTHVGFDTFTLERGNPENAFGRAFYFSNSISDVNRNYAGKGPDLTQRIELLADKLRNEDEKISYQEAKDRARAQLLGEMEAVYPVYLSIQNPVVVEPKGGTRFELELVEDGDGNIIDEKGTAVDLMKAVQAVALKYGVQMDSVWGPISEIISDEPTAYDIDKKIRENEDLLDVRGPGDEILVSEFIRDVWQEMGFDGVIQDAYNAFGPGAGRSMDIDPGTRHFIAFKPNQIKSAVGNRGTFSARSKNILYQPAYHGTPHRGITAFSLGKIGTGEGAQAYGWGLYFAEKYGVAEDYRKRLSQGTIYLDGKYPSSDVGRKIAQRLIDAGYTSSSGLGFKAAKAKVLDHLHTMIMHDSDLGMDVTHFQEEIDLISSIKHASHSDSYALPLEDTISILRERAQARITEIMESEDWKLADKLGEEYADEYDAFLAARDSDPAAKGSARLHELEKLLESAEDKRGEEFRPLIQRLRYFTDLYTVGVENKPDTLTSRGVKDFWDLTQILARGGEETFGDAIRHFEKDTGIHTADLVTPPAGQTYKVDLPEKSTLLDYDKKMSEQSPEVIEKLNSAGFKFGSTKEEFIAKLEELRDGLENEADRNRVQARIDKAKADDLSEYLQSRMITFNGDPLGVAGSMTGKKFYEEVGLAVLRAAREGKYVDGSDLESGKASKAASKALLKAGIPGLIYLDGTSRNKAKKQTHNFVMWDEASIKILEELHQKAEQGAGDSYRGKFEFDDTRKWFKITLTGSANLSTFLHESGHAFLEILRRDATAGDRQAANDIAILEAWMAEGTANNTERLEKFARGFEVYGREGKAPSSALAQVFADFKAWLKLIYATLRGLNVDLTDEVRGVMDRMLASDEEIEKARTAIGLIPALGPTELNPEELKAFNERYAAAVEAKKAELEHDALASLRRALKDAETGIRAEVEIEANSRKDFNATEFLRTGKTLDGSTIAPEAGLKLSKATIKEYMEEGDRRFVKLLSMIADDGTDADAMAPFLGYASGQDLVTALLDAPPRAKWVADRAKVRMADKYPDADLSVLAGKAMDKLHDPQIDGLLEAELDAFERKTGKAPAPRARDVLRLAARRRVEEMNTQEMQPGKYARAEERASREVLAAVAKKDYAAARDARRRQMWNRFMYREISQAKEEISGIRDYLATFETVPVMKRIGKAGERYIDSIHAITEGIDLSKTSNTALARRAALEKYLQEMEDEGEPVAIPAELRAELGLKSWKQMTLSEIRAVRDAVKNIETLAKLKNKLFDGRQRREFIQTTTKLSEHVRANVGINFKDGIGEPSWWTTKKEFLRRARANMSKIEFIARTLDGGKTAGWAHELLFEPLAAAQAKKFQMTKEITEKLMKPFKEMSLKDRLRFDRPMDFLGHKLRYREVIALILNLGNEGNKTKLLKGFNLTEQAVTDKLSEMWAKGEITNDDLDLVQHIWDTINKLWPEISALSQRNIGIAPTKVEPAAIQIGGRTLQGGYYPVVYNRRLTHKAEQIAQRKTGDLFENNFLLPAVEKGFTESRTQFFAPISLSLDVIPSHINDVIHYLTHYEAVRAVDKITSSKVVREAITEGLGREVYGLFRPWLQAIAADGQVHESTKWYDAVLRRLRLGSSIALLGFKVTTGLKQIFGLATSAKEIGHYTFTGMRILSENIAKGRGFGEIVEKSSEFANLDEQHDRDMAAMFRSLESGAFSIYGQAKDKIAHFALAWMMLNQKAVNAVTWYGAREKAFRENHPDPERYANSVVRMTQSGGGIKDLAAIQRGSEMERTMTVMYTYFSVLFNQVTEGMPGKSKGQKVAILAARWWWLITLPALMDAMARAGVPDDDEDKEKYLEALTTGQILYFGRSIPLAGQVAESFIGDRQARYGAWVETLLRGAQSSKDVLSGDATASDVKNVVDLLGAASGLPASAVKNAYLFADEYLNGSMEEPVQNLLFRTPGDFK